MKKCLATEEEEEATKFENWGRERGYGGGRRGEEEGVIREWKREGNERGLTL